MRHGHAIAARLALALCLLTLSGTAGAQSPMTILDSVPVPAKPAPRDGATPEPAAKTGAVEPPAAPEAAPDVPPARAGELAESQGRVTARLGREAIRDIGPGAPVYVADVVATGPEDKGKVLFDDGSSLDIGPDSVARLTEFAYDPTSATGSRQTVAMAKGLFRFVSGKVTAQNPDNLRLESPLAVIGIRGTTTDHKVVSRQVLRDGAPVYEVEDELHALRESKKPTTEVVVTHLGLKTILKKPDMAVELKPRLPGKARALTEAEKKEFATIPLSPAPFDPRPGKGLVGGAN